jgi:hypothetical protein
MSSYKPRFQGPAIDTEGVPDFPKALFLYKKTKYPYLEGKIDIEKCGWNFHVIEADGTKVS